MTFPNDYHGVHTALTAGRQVEAGSELGRHFQNLAQAMLDSSGSAVAAAPVAPPIAKKKGLLDLFSFKTTSSRAGLPAPAALNSRDS